MDLYTYSKQVVRDAGAFIKARMSLEFDVLSKSNANDLVTDVDKETEQFITRRIQEEYPAHKLVGEEFKEHSIEDDSGYVWVIDPIDGTMNFVHQQINFTISVGIYRDGAPIIGLVLDVMNDTLYHAQKGMGAYINDSKLPQLTDTILERSLISMNPKWMLHPNISQPFVDVARASRQTRNYGSAALEFAYVAAGRLEGAVFFRLSPWDFAAGMVLVEEVGGVMTNALGHPLKITQNDSVIAGSREVQRTMVDHFRTNASFVSHHKEHYQF